MFYIYACPARSSHIQQIYRNLLLYESEGEEEGGEDEGPDGEEIPERLKGIYQLLILPNKEGPLMLREVPEAGEVMSLCDRKTSALCVGMTGRNGAAPARPGMNKSHRLTGGDGPPPKSCSKCASDRSQRMTQQSPPSPGSHQTKLPCLASCPQEISR
jgi:hypothetical protein